MKAEIHPGYDRKRTMLGEAIPLRTPFTIFINPSTICNFQCYYCTHGKEQNELNEIGFVQKNMDFSIFLEIAQQLTEFQDKFKLIYLYGNGEPLCNPKLPEMIEHLSRIGVSEKLEFFTNGALLTPQKSLAIIDAGLTKLKVSVQALDSNEYRKMTGVDCDFNRLVEHVRFFYEHRKNCKVYIKIMDTGYSENDKNKFYKIFGDICDEIFIEHMTFTQRTMEGYEGVLTDRVNLYGEPLTISEVCSFPFYVIRIGVNGEINPCFEKVFEERLNVNNVTLYEYWESAMLRDFHIMHLQKERSRNKTCNGCCCTSSTSKLEDLIDSFAKDILERMEVK